MILGAQRTSHLQMLRVWCSGRTRLLCRHRHPRRLFTTSKIPPTETAANWLGKALITGALLFVGGITIGKGCRNVDARYNEESRLKEENMRQEQKEQESSNDTVSAAWTTITSTLATLSAATPSISITALLPEWTLVLPSYFQKLRAELSMAPGSLSYELWQESLSPYLNPELRWDARVRISPNLCDEEQAFVRRRRKFIKSALARYLDIPEEEINEEDIPVIAMTTSGGGVRAMVSASGSFWACKSDGLYDCTTFTAGVSGSCWMQALYLSTLSNASFPRLVEHLKARLRVHFAFPPTALSLLEAAPTNRYLLRGVVERAKRGYTSFGLVDVYGVLLAARLLVPANELGVNDDDLKLSSQRKYLENGENPMPIYTCVRHEIPGLREADKGNEAEKLKAAAAQDWFQWFEITPFEFYCEDLEAGIPTWSLGRRFHRGFNIDREVPELKLPLLLGIFGSAFCATLNHYYDEIRPFLVGLGWGLQKVDSLIIERRHSLKTVHPFEPACIPNYVKGLGDFLPPTCPKSLHEAENIQLMDAGMSNNLACYPLLRRGRNVDILIAFDSSAEIQTCNWIGNAEGYAKQKKITGWPVSIGWPKPGDSHPEEQLATAQAASEEDAKERFKQAQEADRATKAIQSMQDKRVSVGPKGLGYCTVWVGSKQEKTTDEEPPPSKAVEDEWELMKPDAGITVVYFPLIPNEMVPGVDPEISSYLSTWNFEWTPNQVDSTVALAKANYSEGKDKVRRTVRAVYERKKKLRLEREQYLREAYEQELDRLHLEEEIRHGRNERWFGHAFH
ncbi:acyl transferase/acyl hydrolase/lysophospholipase [Kalaharituber pfeilii]|nr:acyl transferase/acyl hydrolase/lysophospholipase [Kalaharituber pfeilii]